MFLDLSAHVWAFFASLVVGLDFRASTVHLSWLPDSNFLEFCQVSLALTDISWRSSVSFIVVHWSSYHYKRPCLSNNLGSRLHFKRSQLILYEDNWVVPSLGTAWALNPIRSWTLAILAGSFKLKYAGMPLNCVDSSTFWGSFDHSFLAFSYSSRSSCLNSIRVGFLRSIFAVVFSSKMARVLSLGGLACIEPLISRASGVTIKNKMAAAFENQKLAVLSQADLSKKGSIDDPIKGLIQYINDTENFFSTSSCSGRICVFSSAEVGVRSSLSQLWGLCRLLHVFRFLQDVSDSRKKSGRWLFVSHEAAIDNTVVRISFPGRSTCETLYRK